MAPERRAELTVIRRTESAAPVGGSKLRDPHRGSGGGYGDAETEDEAAPEEHADVLCSRDNGRADKDYGAPDSHAHATAEHIAGGTSKERANTLSDHVYEEY